MEFILHLLDSFMSCVLLLYPKHLKVFRKQICFCFKQQVKPQQNVQQQTQQQQQNQQQLELAVVKNECVENGSQQVDTSGDAKKPWMKTGVNSKYLLQQ